MPSQEELVQVLAEPTRLQIIAALAGGEMTINQLAIALKLTPPNIHHHMKLLLRTDLIEPSSTRMRGNLMEKYYRLKEKLNAIEIVGRQLSLKERRKAASACASFLMAMAGRALKVIEESDPKKYSPTGTIALLFPARREVLREVWSEMNKAIEGLRSIEERYRSKEGAKSILVFTLIPYQTYHSSSQGQLPY